MTDPGTSRITLDWPAAPGYEAIGRLVVAGVAGRCQLPYERVDELGLALDTLVREGAGTRTGRYSVEIDASPDRLRLVLAGFASDPLEDPSVRRVVAALVDRAESTGPDGDHRVVLSTSSGRDTAG